MRLNWTLSLCLTVLCAGSWAAPEATKPAAAKPSEAETARLQAAYATAAAADGVKAAEARVKEIQAQAKGGTKSDQAGLKMSAKSAEADLLTAYRNAMLKADPDLPSDSLEAFLQNARRTQNAAPAKPKPKAKK